MGSPSVGFPGADRILATAAQRARLPYTLSAVGGMTIEEAAAVAPDVLWFQLPRLARDDHKLGRDLVRRAHEAGAHALVLTMDTPTRTTRPREVASGVTTPFRVDLRMLLGILAAPAWLMAMRRHGVPRFASFRRYAPNASVAEMAEFVRGQTAGAFSWDEVAMLRDLWKRPLLVKGIAHPARCGARARDRLRRCRGVDPRRPPGGGAAGAGGHAAGDRAGDRRPRHGDPGFRRDPAATTWCARSHSAPTPPSPARPSCGAWARSARAARCTPWTC